MRKSALQRYVGNLKQRLGIQTFMVKSTSWVTGIHWGEITSFSATTPPDAPLVASPLSNFTRLYRHCNGKLLFGTSKYLDENQMLSGTRTHGYVFGDHLEVNNILYQRPKGFCIIKLRKIMFSPVLHHAPDLLSSAASPQSSANTLVSIIPCTNDISIRYFV